MHIGTGTRIMTSIVHNGAPAPNATTSTSTMTTPTTSTTTPTTSTTTTPTTSTTTPMTTTTTSSTGSNFTWPSAAYSIPSLFAQIEPKLYRCRMFQPQHFTFIATLRLRTVVWLAPEYLPPVHMAFLAAHNIALLNYGVRYYEPTDAWQPLSPSLLKHALETMLSNAHQPVLFMCPTGFSYTGVVVGCLRKMQGWALSSILEEYERMSGSKSKLAHELAIEMFDVDLVSVSVASDACRWWTEQLSKRKLERQWLRQSRVQALSADVVHPNANTDAAPATTGASAISVIAATSSPSAADAITVSLPTGQVISSELFEYYERLFQHLGRWKLVSSNSHFDPKRSIIQEDED